VQQKDGLSSSHPQKRDIGRSAAARAPMSRTCRVARSTDMDAARDRAGRLRSPSVSIIVAARDGYAIPSGGSPTCNPIGKTPPSLCQGTETAGPCERLNSGVNGHHSNQSAAAAVVHQYGVGGTAWLA